MPDEVNVEATRERAARANNLFLPIYTDPTTQGQDKFTCQEYEQIHLDAAFGRASGVYDENTTDELVYDVFAQLVKLMPRLRLVSPLHDPSNGDWHWAKARCLLSGAGYRLYQRLVIPLHDIYPMCSLDPDETLPVWRERLLAAHQMCGWPVSLALAEWSAVSRSIEHLPGGEAETQDWHRVMALVHILKHVRFSRTQGVVITYNGTASCIERSRDTNNLAGTGRRGKDFLFDKLGIPSNDGKRKHPLSLAASSVLSDMTFGDLLPRRQLADLPGCVLAGPWTRLVPTPTGMTEFIQHGLRLSDVWIAADGRVTSESGDAADVVSYDWEINDTSEVHAHERARFLASIPSTYDVDANPSDVMLWAFPNISFTRYQLDPDVYRATLDAIICSALIGTDCPALALEKPFLVFMPADPQPDEATNQGKTHAATVVANCISPGIGKAQAMSRNTDTPGLRASAEDIRRFGTLNLDEWVMPGQPTHLLSHTNLQSLLTGGSITAGKVFDNGSHAVFLRYPLIANCKVFPVPPDLINRCFPTFLDQFTNEQRARSNVVSEVESGKLAVRMRLAGIGLIERMELADLVNRLDLGTTNEGMRYPRIRGLAAAILGNRTRRSIEACLPDIDRYMQAVRSAVNLQLREAEQSGLLAQQEDGDGVTVRAYSIFSELGIGILDQFITLAKLHSADGGLHGLTPSSMLKARLEIAGMGGRPLATLLQYIGGRTRNVSDRSMAQALSRDLRALLPAVGDRWVLPDICGERGWFLRRISDNNGAVRVQLEQNAPATHTTRLTTPVEGAHV